MQILNSSRQAWLFLALILGGTDLWAEPTPFVTIREPWSNVFGGRDSTFHVSVMGPTSFVGRLGWQLATEGRTLIRGESVVTVSATLPGVADIHLPIPAVKPGAIMPVRLSVLLANADSEVGRCEKLLWVFSEDPFAGRREWLKALRVKLFDPIGSTSKLLDGLEVPYSTVRSVESLAAVNEGVVLIGEGVSFRDYRGLGISMMKTAATGVSVICLAPSEGEIVLPSADAGNLPRPTSMEFHCEEVIRQLDKRLDSHTWAPEGRSVARGLILKGERGPILAEVGSDSSGWSWIELDYASNNTKCVICEFAIVEKWAASPTPRFLLVKLLESVAGKYKGE